MRCRLWLVLLLIGLGFFGCSAPGAPEGANGGAAGHLAGTGGDVAGELGGGGAVSASSGAGGAIAASAGAGVQNENGGAPSAGSGQGGAAGAAENGGASGVGGGNPAAGAAGALAGAGGAAAFDPCPKNGPCAVMPLGDSITEGYRSSDYGGYREPLFALTLKAKQTLTFVGSAPPRGPLTVDGVPFPRANEGVGGRRIADIAALIPSTLDENQPNVILLHIGTNDLSSGATIMTRELGALLDKIVQARPSALLVLARIIPSRLASSNATIAVYDDSMPALVDARVRAGKHIVLVDMHAAFTANANYASALLYDDYHPRDAGYSLMATTWYSAIKDSLH